MTDLIKFGNIFFCVWIVCSLTGADIENEYK